MQLCSHVTVQIISSWAKWMNRMKSAPVPVQWWVCQETELIQLQTGNPNDVITDRQLVSGWRKRMQTKGNGWVRAWTRSPIIESDLNRVQVWVKKDEAGIKPAGERMPEGLAAGFYPRRGLKRLRAHFVCLCWSASIACFLHVLWNAESLWSHLNRLAVKSYEKGKVHRVER